MIHESPSHIRPLAKPIYLNAPGASAGLLLIHGFADAPYSMRDLAHFLHAQGYIVSVPRLPGHGSRLTDLSRTRVVDWQQGVGRALDALRTRTQRIGIIGRSFGGVLGMLEIAKRPSVAAALVTLAAPKTLPWQRSLETMVTVLRPFRRSVKKPWMQRQEKVVRLEVGRYEQMPLPALADFLRTLRHLDAHFLRTVTIPTLLIQGRDDTLAPADSLDFFHQHLGSTVKETFWVEGVAHSAADLHEHQEVQQRILGFLSKHGLAPR